MHWQSLPPLSALRAFAALAETGSFTRAGEALNVSHAAVSQQVRALEERLGVLLVVRGGARGRLTPEGEGLAQALAGAFAGIAQAVEELTGADGRPLYVTTTSAFAANWLMPRLSEFRHLHPGVELMLNPTSQLVALEPGGVDVAIRFGKGNWRGLDVELLVPTSMVLVGAVSLLADRTIREPRDILGLPWLQELGTSEMSNWLRDRGVIAPRKDSVIHLPGHLVLEGVRNGDGVSLASRVVVERELASGRVVALFEDVEPGTGYYIVTRPGVMRRSVKTFVAWLRRQAPDP
ncbi:MAG: LysR family transcriptional regulator [Amaricoccus sp.]|uniref:LysR family transcriptional regulator n=1 Tax=Amaricoccus sp. TaxID=1872485 RepID=UPI0039E6B58C